MHEDGEIQQIDEYFNSIKESFETTLKTESKQDFWGSIFSFALAACIFSVIPVLPIIIWILTRWLLPGWAVHFWRWPLPVQSFWFWYVVCILVSIPSAIIINTADNRSTRRRKRNSLGAASMRFALCYAVAQEIDRFIKNRLQKHLDRATTYWEELFPRLMHGLDLLTAMQIRAEVPDGRLVASSFGVFSSELDVLSRFYPWFKLDPVTERILDALASLQLKISGRIKDKKDLPSVAGVLQSLAAYYYSLIPEISSTEMDTGKQVTELGERSLIRFADAISLLPPYSPEPQPLEGKDKVTFKFASAIAWVGGLYCHDNLLLRFFVWWLLIQVFVLVAVLMASHYIPNLRIDSTLVTLVIGTPLVVSAAALAGVLRRK